MTTIYILNIIPEDFTGALSAKEKAFAYLVGYCRKNWYYVFGYDEEVGIDEDDPPDLTTTGGLRSVRYSSEHKQFAIHSLHGMAHVGFPIFLGELARLFLVQSTLASSQF